MSAERRAEEMREQVREMVVECVREAVPEVDEWTLTAGNPVVQCLVEEMLWY